MPQVTPITGYLNAQTVTFYMPVLPANNTVSCKITINGVSVIATGTLNVVTPTVRNVIGTPGPDGILLLPPDVGGGLILEDGQATYSVQNHSGMTFTADALSPPPNFNLPAPNPPFPPGSTNWLQVLQNDDINVIRKANPSKPFTYDGKLDTTDYRHWPYNGYADKINGSAYAVSDLVNDSPKTPILANPPISEIDRTFVANMYYMWKPNIPTANGMPDTIWVPLQEITWGFFAKASAPSSAAPIGPNPDPTSKANFPASKTTAPAAEPTWNDAIDYSDLNDYVLQP